MSSEGGSAPSGVWATASGRTARVAGYVVAAAVNAGLLFVVNVFPGWAAAPFLSASAATVIPLLNASLAVGIVTSLVNAVVDRRWVRAAGDIVSSSVALWFLATTWRVFPFVLDDQPADWTFIVRMVLLVAMAACVLSIITQAVLLIGEVGRRRRRAPEAGARH